MKIGLTLGAGGARGLAHISFLEVFEEFGIKPSIISGASIGAIIGAVYASGVSASELKASVDEIVFRKSGKFWEIHKRSDLINVLNFVDPVMKQGGIIKGEKFVNFLGEKLKISNFSELKIPLKIVATDFLKNSERVFSTGNLLQSIRASFALPGLFSPVTVNGHYYIDGGVSNPLPYDIIANECDLIIAIDVSSNKSVRFNEIPPAYEILFAGYSMQQRAIIREKLKRLKPDIYIDTDISNVRVHEFNKAHEIYSQVERLKNKLRRKLENKLAS